VNVNTITVTLSSANAASITNLRLVNDATGAQIGSTVTSPSTSNSFSGTFSIPVSNSATIDIYGNVLSNANAGPWIATAAATGNGMSSGSAVSSGSSGNLQSITLGTGTLSVTQGAGDLVSTNAVAGSTNVPVGQFTFTGSNSSYTVQSLGILVPNAGASAVSSLQLQYTNSSGTVVTSPSQPVVSTGSTYATASFSGLSAFVPLNSTGSVTVLANLAPVGASNASGNSIHVTLDAGGVSGNDNTFRAIDSSGNLSTTVNSATNVSSNGTLYVRQTLPTYQMVSTGNTTPSTGSPLYEFSISAASAGAVDWTKVSFNIATTNVTVTNVYLVNTAQTGQNLLDNSTNSASTTATSITMDLNKNVTQPKHQQIAAGGTVTYALYGTVAGWTTGSSLTISLASDNSSTANGTAATVAAVPSNIVWSDESSVAMNGTSHSVGSSDWTNGYLLQNFTSDATSYSH
jgi:hypothetical protein